MDGATKTIFGIQTSYDSLGDPLKPISTGFNACITLITRVRSRESKGTLRSCTGDGINP